MAQLDITPKQATRRSQRGFTLIEVLVAMAVFGILSSLAAITLGSLAPKFDLDNAARSAAMAMTRAKVQAITRGHATKITLEGGVFTTKDEATGEYIGDGEFSSALTLSGTDEYVFSPLGTASAGPLTLSNGEHSRDIVVGLIGTVEIE